MKKIALLGFGTVGQGVFNILKEKKDELKKRGFDLEVKKILVRNLNKVKDFDPSLFTNDFEDILKDDEIDLAIEMTGDLENSYIYISKLLKAKKDVITSNKSVLSLHFEEFLNLSKENGAKIYFEAAVGGTVPVVREVKALSIFNRIYKIYGILNGTSNYILYNMFENKADYSEVLEKAQELGYAERDPSDDVLGYDMRRKLRILMSLIGGGKITEDEIEVFGLDKITKIDVEYLGENYRVKELALGKFNKNKFVGLVEPALFKKDEDLARLDDANNMVEIYGDYFEKLTLKGKGAGRYPTASAVVCDLIDLLSGNDWEISSGNDLINENKNFKASYYLRTKGDFPKDLIASQEEFKGYKIIRTKAILRSDLIKNIKDEDSFFARIEEND